MKTTTPSLSPLTMTAAAGLVSGLLVLGAPMLALGPSLVAAVGAAAIFRRDYRRASAVRMPKRTARAAADRRVPVGARAYCCA